MSMWITSGRRHWCSRSVIGTPRAKTSDADDAVRTLELVSLAKSQNEVSQERTWFYDQFSRALFVCESASRR